MENKKGIPGNRKIGYFLLAAFLVGLGYLSSLIFPPHPVSKGPSKPIISETGETYYSNQPTTHSGKSGTVNTHIDEKKTTVTGKSQPNSSTITPSNNTPQQFPLRESTRDITPKVDSIVTADLVANDTVSKETVKSTPPTPRQKAEKPGSKNIPKAVKKRVHPYFKQGNTNIYIIYGNQRIDPETGEVMETYPDSRPAVKPMKKVKKVAKAKEDEKVIHNHNVNIYVTENPNKEQAAEKEEPKTAINNEKESWYGGYSAISTNPQTTIGEAYRERLKTWPCGNDMYYAGPDYYNDYYGGGYYYPNYSYPPITPYRTGVTGYVKMGNITMPVGGGGYSSGGYIKMGNVYLPTSSYYYYNGPGVNGYYRSTSGGISGKVIIRESSKPVRRSSPTKSKSRLINSNTKKLKVYSKASAKKTFSKNSVPGISKKNNYPKAASRPNTKITLISNKSSKTVTPSTKSNPVIKLQGGKTIRIETSEEVTTSK